MHKFLWPLLPLAVAACAAPPRGEEPVAPAAPVAAAPGARRESRRRGQVTGSHLEVRVYRDGPMQKLGHDHLIISERLAGEIQLREPLAASRFALRLPLDSLEVDDPEARAAAGGDFVAPVPDKDREATRHNMLGEKLLDAARQGEMLLTAESVSGGPGRLRSAGAGVAGRQRTCRRSAVHAHDRRRTTGRACDIPLEPRRSRPRAFQRRARRAQGARRLRGGPHRRGRARHVTGIQFRNPEVRMSGGARVRRGRSNGPGRHAARAARRAGRAGPAGVLRRARGPVPAAGDRARHEHRTRAADAADRVSR